MEIVQGIGGFFMRIDNVLCAKILIAVEEHPDEGTGDFIRPSIDGYDAKQLNHHIKYLFDEGMIEGQDVTVWSSEGTEIMIQSITPAGRRYLDSLVPEPERKRVGFTQA
jgi:Hypothetical protein (DUF2513)